MAFQTKYALRRSVNGTGGTRRIHGSIQVFGYTVSGAVLREDAEAEEALHQCETALDALHCAPVVAMCWRRERSCSSTLSRLLTQRYFTKHSVDIQVGGLTSSASKMWIAANSRNSQAVFVQPGYKLQLLLLISAILSEQKSG